MKFQVARALMLFMPAWTMYTGAIVMFLATPLALGARWALLPATGLLAGIVVRLLDEERFLTRHVSGYSTYRHKLRFRLIPGLW